MWYSVQSGSQGVPLQKGPQKIPTPRIDIDGDNNNNHNMSGQAMACVGKFRVAAGRCGGAWRCVWVMSPPRCVGGRLEGCGDRVGVGINVHPTRRSEVMPSCQGMDATPQERGRRWSWSAVAQGRRRATAACRGMPTGPQAVGPLTLCSPTLCLCSRTQPGVCEAGGQRVCLCCVTPPLDGRAPCERPGARRCAGGLADGGAATNAPHSASTLCVCVCGAQPGRDGAREPAAR